MGLFAKVHPGLSVRHVVHADRATLERFDPPQETVTSMAWATKAEYPALWNDASHLHPSARSLRCTEGQPHGLQCRSEADGAVTVVGFEAEAGGGFKVRTVVQEIDFPDCLL